MYIDIQVSKEGVAQAIVTFKTNLTDNQSYNEVLPWSMMYNGVHKDKKCLGQCDEKYMTFLT